MDADLHMVDDAYSLLPQPIIADMEDEGVRA